MDATNINVRVSSLSLIAGLNVPESTERKRYSVDKAVENVERILGFPPGSADQEGHAPHIVSLIRGMVIHGAQPSDPVREFSSFMGEQWSVLLLLLLRDGPFRYSVLHRLVAAAADDGPISQRILTLKMRSLERNGLVARRVTPCKPPRVDYELTALGGRFIEQVGKFAEWVISETPHIIEAREEFDRS